MSEQAKTDASDIQVTDTGDALRFVYLSRNPFVTQFILMFAFFPALFLVAFFFSLLEQGAWIKAAALFVILVYGVKLLWPMIWRRKPHLMVIDASGLQTRTGHFAFHEIEDIQVHSAGGGLSLANPNQARNQTNGPHLSVKANGQFVPVTAPLSSPQARALLEKVRAAQARFDPDFSPQPTPNLATASPRPMSDER